MIEVTQLENELMHSNCYIVYDDATNECLIVDPGSRLSLREIEFVSQARLCLLAILLTHEHTDHTWGVNALLDEFPDAKVVAYSKCIEQLPAAGDLYFRLYYDDCDYHYEVRKVDLPVYEEGNMRLGAFDLHFIPTPGHSIGSMAIVIDRFIFTGDTLMKYAPFVSKKTGDVQTMKESCSLLMERYPDTVVCPGHGDMFAMAEFRI